LGAVVAVLVFWAAIGGLIGYAIGNGKGRGSEGFWLGFLLGVIGWIIVAVMSPSEEVAAERTAAITAAVQAAAVSSSPGPCRECPWCAETIKAAARVCRYCGRAVDPLEPEQIETEELDYVRDEFPTIFDRAFPLLQRLPTPPERPVAWLRELCVRIDAGSPPETAAARIALDWSGPGPSRPARMPVPAGPGDPASAGEYPGVVSDFPAAYESARALMAGLAEQPAHPEAWLRELCTRIGAGSPPEAAAARIPLDWQ
jgi:Uncharacterised protein family UPF0547